MGILEEFSKRMAQKRTAVPYKGFGSEDDLTSRLLGNKYVILTSQNPKRKPEKGPFDSSVDTPSPPPDDPRNIEAFREMMDELDARGLYYTTHVGKWRGDPEYSLIVWAPESVEPDGEKEEDFFTEMFDLAQEYGQESIMAATPEAKSTHSLPPQDEGEYDTKKENPKTELFGDFTKDPTEGPAENITPFGKELKELTGQPQEKVQFTGEEPYESEMAEGRLHWTFNPVDWSELTEEMQQKVKDRVVQREQR